MPSLIGPNAADVIAAFPEFAPLEELEAGGQKVVLKGRDKDVAVVLKVTKKWVPEGDDEEQLELEAILDDRIRGEIKHLKEIKSDYFVTILRGPDTREIGGHMYAWYLEPFYSTSLRPKVKAEEWSQARVVELTAHLLSAVGVLIDQHAVHRDIKPENIVFRDDGRPVLLDLGASLFANEPTVTEEGDVAPFTKQYSAPEQWVQRERGENDMDFRTDLFCIGLVTYELLTQGRWPFGVAMMDWAAYKKRVREHNYDRANLRKTATETMCEFVDRALRPEQNARYRTLELARTALEACK